MTSMTRVQFESKATEQFQIALEVIQLDPKVKMKLYELRDCYVSAQWKIFEGMKCGDWLDYLLKPTKIGIAAINYNLKEVLACQKKDELIHLIQFRGYEIFGIDLTDKERLACHLYTEYLSLPFAQYVEKHIAHIMGKG